MTHRLVMICAARPKRLVFPGGDAADGDEYEPPARVPRSVLRAGRFWCGPDPISRRSATALGLEAEIRPELADIDFGTWRGRPLEDVARADPKGFRSWTSDPSAAPHGGECIEDLLDRLGWFLSACAALAGSTVAVAPGSVVKACLLHALAAPPTSYFRMDVEPLSHATFVSDGRRWNLRLPAAIESDARSGPGSSAS
ncbi:histidine phosphatase family protein [Ancylobacter terrae]|uniref:histidine phosphatase family protein n=1 Tax=Ancylobacter sp. sgz301288 TaxID=3342077 RepID=UPI00385D2C2A